MRTFAKVFLLFTQKRRKMLKKHLIACVIILGLFVMAKVFAYNLPHTKEQYVYKTLSTPTIQKEERPLTLMERLNFANETLPKGDKIVEQKMRRILAAHSHTKIQSHKLHEKASEWFPVVEPILERYGIPEDFKYMPLVESGVKGGVSPKGAAGYWQFMPATARLYGLKVNGKVDERYDLEKSTIAASKYLRDLYQIFGNWILAAAAYNLGDTRLKQHIRVQKQNNYFKMKLNSETGGYVYKLISMKEIIDQPIKYGYNKIKVDANIHTE